MASNVNSELPRMYLRPSALKRTAYYPDEEKRQFLKLTP